MAVPNPVSAGEPSTIEGPRVPRGPGSEALSLSGKIRSFRTLEAQAEAVTARFGNTATVTPSNSSSA